MQKRDMHETHSKIMLSQSRYIPINIFNLITLPGSVKIHAHLTKIGLNNFLEI